jgi:hypothetical protein
MTRARPVGLHSASSGADGSEVVESRDEKREWSSGRAHDARMFGSMYPARSRDSSDAGRTCASGVGGGVGVKAQSGDGVCDSTDANEDEDCVEEADDHDEKREGSSGRARYSSMYRSTCVGGVADESQVGVGVGGGGNMTPNFLSRTMGFEGRTIAYSI